MDPDRFYFNSFVQFLKNTRCSKDGGIGNMFTYHGRNYNVETNNLDLSTILPRLTNSYFLNERAGNKSRLFFDIDSKDEWLTPVFKDILKNKIKDIVKKIFGVSNTPVYIVVNNKFPRSKAHIYVPDIVVDKSVRRFLYSELGDTIEILKDKIDYGVSGLRIIGSSKPLANYKDSGVSSEYKFCFKPDKEKGRYLPSELIGDPSLEGGVMARNNLTSDAVKKLSILTGEKPTRLRDEYFDCIYPKQQTFEEEDEHSPNDEKLIIALIKDFTEENFSIEKQGNIYVLTRLFPSDCRVCNREHDKENQFVWTWRGKIYLGCHRKKGNVFIGAYRNHIFDKTLLGGTDVNLGKYLAGIVKNDIMIDGDSTSDRVLIFNPVNRVWESKVRTQTLVHLQTILIDIYTKSIISVRERMKTINDEKSDESIELSVQLGMLTKNKKKIGSVSAMGNIYTTVHGLLKVSNVGDRINSMSRIFPFSNGTLFDFNLDLIRTIEKNDYVTDPSNFSPETDPVKLGENRLFIDNFFSTVFKREKEKIRYFQKSMGYCLMKDIKAQKFFILTGSGANGKDTYLNGMELILGNSMGNGNNKILLKGGIDNNSSANSHTSAMNNMKNKRVVRFKELKNDTFDATVIKVLTGSSSINIRRLNQEEEKMDITFKIIIDCNNIPDQDTIDQALMRRMVIFDFPMNFDKQWEGKENYLEKDANMGDKITKNILGLLDWLIEGGRRYILEGLDDAPKSISISKNRYIDVTDTVGFFSKDYLEKTSSLSDGKISGSELYSMYCEWSRINSIKNVSSTAFGKDIKKHLDSHKTNKAIFYLCKERVIDEEKYSDEKDSDSEDEGTISKSPI